MYTEDELHSMGFAYVGRGVKIFRNSLLVNCQNIYLGDGCQIDDFVHIIASRYIRIGKRVHVACFTSIAGGGDVILSDYCGLSAGCRLISGSEDFGGGGMTNPCTPREYRKVERSFIELKKHVLLGTNTIVHPGVTIYDGAVTGSATLVTKDLDAWGIYIGIPAKRIKERPKETILACEGALVSKYGY